MLGCPTWLTEDLVESHVVNVEDAIHENIIVVAGGPKQRRGTIREMKRFCAKMLPRYYCQVAVLGHMCADKAPKTSQHG